MSHTQTYETIVLQTYDVGEADRFCVLLTRERGRLAARARAVRKPGSRLGGSLLPHRRLRVNLHEGKTGYMVTGAYEPASDSSGGSLQTFLRRQEMCELLLKLLHDEEPLPDVFDLTAECLREDTPDISTYTVRLLRLLGLLAEDENPALCRSVIAEHSNGALRVEAIVRSMEK